MGYANRVTTLKKEIFWFLGVFLFLFCLTFGASGFRNFDLSGKADINIHDTYFVVDHLHIFLTQWVTLFFWVYLIRMLANRFTNMYANLIFIISSLLMIYIFSYLTNLSNLFLQQINEENRILMDSKGWSIAYNIFISIQAILVI